jgi:predicted O-methyltransferase YrrM
MSQSNPRAAQIPPALRAYLAEGYDAVPGMSSRLAAAVTAELLAFQSERGVIGSLVEIGVYRGRFFILLALAAQPGEACLAIDPFDWPDASALAEFQAQCRAHGVDMNCVHILPVASNALAAPLLTRSLRGFARFIHIDGDHSYAALRHDMAMAFDVLHDEGLVLLDDILHPLYPDLTTAARDELLANDAFVLLAVIDRESFKSAAKFLICRRNMVEIYEGILIARLASRIYRKRARFGGRKALVILPAD